MRLDRLTNRLSFLWIVAAFGNALLAAVTASYFFLVFAVICAGLARRAWNVEGRTRNRVLAHQRGSSAS